ncbi:hypothetical protein CTI12_AA385810 [Artemisia annua]|uniref:Uncharacterized protein n=1 Tax=Artemisia annua TaxID=35608 RepID=A0A2U1MBI3_ARTAN|nr:hypothetical protein CTI12_AA385810 [Artemisia annua]
MPYDYKNTTPSGPESQKRKFMLETLNHLHCGDRCVVGSGGGSVGFDAQVDGELSLNVNDYVIVCQGISAYIGSRLAGKVLATFVNRKLET